MTWKTLRSPLAITSRRKVVASAIIYGLSLAVRFTSATGEEVEIPPQFVQSTDSAIAIISKDGSQPSYLDFGLNAAQPIVLRHSGPLTHQSCHVACVRDAAVPAPSRPSCLSP